MDIVIRLAMIVAILVFAPDAGARSLQVIHSFTGLDGEYPEGKLVFDKTGLIYGTTVNANVPVGDPGSYGSLYKIDPTTGVLTTLYQFTGGTDGGAPLTGLVAGENGDYYGMTFYGGDKTHCFGAGCGTIFRFNTTTGILMTLHKFNGSDGYYPMNYGRLIYNPKNKVLFGTTSNGGVFDLGTVFKFDIVTSTLTTLHSFSGGKAGQRPFSGLVADANGVLYGTTTGHTTGTEGEPGGTLFRLDTGHGTFTSYANIGGYDPEADMVIDKQGFLYGTCRYGGLGSGTVFRLDPTTGVVTTLHSFTGSDGQIPQSGVTLDRTGQLYGTAWGGPKLGGVIFKLDPTTGVFVLLYDFDIDLFEGQNPFPDLVFHDNGALYGTNDFGGVGAAGTIFKLSP